MKLKNLFVFFFTVIIFTQNLSSCESLNQENKDKFITLLSTNIDTNITKVEEGLARESHPEWRVKARMDDIKSNLGTLIEKYQPDIVQIQEGRKFTTKFGDKVNSIGPLINFLNGRDYSVSTEKYNPSERSFSYITGIKSKFDVSSHKLLYFTESPNLSTNHDNHQARMADIKRYNHGEEWERSAYFTFFHDKEGEEYCAINIHLGIALEHRLKASSLLSNWSKDIINKNPKIHIVASGDFNTFSDFGGPDQLNIIKEAGILKHGTEKLKVYNTNQTINSSFFAFPYDFTADDQRLNKELNINKILWDLNPIQRKEKIESIFLTECKALGGHLDHVFYYGFDQAKTYLAPTPLFGELKGGYTEDSVKQYIIDHHSQGPAFPTDHQFVISILKL